MTIEASDKDRHINILRERVALLEKECKNLRSSRFGVISLEQEMGTGHIESVKCLDTFATKEQADKYIGGKRCHVVEFKPYWEAK